MRPAAITCMLRGFVRLPFLLLSNTTMACSYDYLFKVLLCGDSGVGKTSILCRFVCDEMNDVYVSTVGVDFKVKTIQMKGKIIKLQVWDTSGQERFKALTAQYFRKAQGIMLVYDLTNEQSFENIISWLRMIQERAMSDVKMMLIANKSDISESRRVTEYRGKQLAKDYGMDFLETSAHTTENLSEAFSSLVEKIFKKMQNQFDIAASSSSSIKKLDSHQSDYSKKESACIC